MIRAWLAHRRTYAEGRVLAALVHGSPASGYDLWHRTGLRSGRLYPALRRLEARELVVAEWDDTGPRPRRLYSAAVKR